MLLKGGNKFCHCLSQSCSATSSLLTHRCFFPLSKACSLPPERLITVGAIHSGRLLIGTAKALDAMPVPWREGKQFGYVTAHPVFSEHLLKGRGKLGYLRLKNKDRESSFSKTAALMAQWLFQDVPRLCGASDSYLIDCLKPGDFSGSCWMTFVSISLEKIIRYAP